MRFYQVQLTSGYNFVPQTWFRRHIHTCIFLFISILFFCNIINVFIINFDQFKASLLNNSINFYNPPPPNKIKKMILTPSELLQKTNKKIEQQQKHVAGDGLIIEMQSDVCQQEALRERSLAVSPVTAVI